MEPTRQHQRAFAVAGIRVRTTNRDEADPDTDRITGLWNRFFHEPAHASTALRTGDARIFGVYSAYASDAHGAFDLTAGVAVSVSGGTDSVAIEAGDYLVFTAQGQMPQAVIAHGSASGSTSRRIRRWYAATAAISKLMRDRTASPSTSACTEPEALLKKAPQTR